MKKWSIRAEISVILAIWFMQAIIIWGGFHGLTPLRVAIIYASVLILPGMQISNLLGFSNHDLRYTLVIQTACGLIFNYPLTILAFYFHWSHTTIYLYGLIGTLLLVVVNMLTQRGRIQSYHLNLKNEWLFYVLAICASLFVAYITQYYYWGADVWLHFSELRHLSESAVLTPYTALYKGKVIDPAYAFNIIHMLWTTMVVQSGASVFSVWSVISSFMTFTVLCGVFVFSDCLFRNKRTALVISILYVFLYFGYYIFYYWGLPLFMFIALPGFIAGYFVMPLMIACTVQAIRKDSDPWLLITILLLPVLLSAHAQYYVFYFITIVPFIVWQLLGKHPVFRWKSAALLGFAFVWVLPAVMVKLFAMKAGTTTIADILPANISISGRPYWLLSEGHLQMLDPTVFLYDISALFFLATLVVFFRDRKSDAARYLLLSAIIPMLIGFVPFLAQRFAQWMSSYLVYRMITVATEMMTFSFLYLISGTILFVYTHSMFIRRKMRLNEWIVICGIVFTALMSPNLLNKLDEFQHKSMNLEVISQNGLFQFFKTLPSGGVVLANKKMSFVIPAFVNLHVLQSRHNSTVTDGLQRSQFFTTLLSGEDSSPQNLFKKMKDYALDYIVIDKGSLFESYGMEYLECTGNYEKIYDDSSYAVLSIKPFNQWQNRICSSERVASHSATLKDGRHVYIDRLHDVPSNSTIEALFDGSDKTALQWNGGRSFRIRLQYPRKTYVKSVEIVRDHPDGITYIDQIRIYGISSGKSVVLACQEEPYYQKSGYYDSAIIVDRALSTMEIEIVGNDENSIVLSEIRIHTQTE